MFIQNYPTPYRVALFNCLSEKYDIECLYVDTSPESRKWDLVLREATFKNFFSEPKKLGVLGRSFNYACIPGEVRARRYEGVITLTSYPDFCTMMGVKLWARRSGIPEYLWVSVWRGYKVSSSTSILSSLEKYFLNVINAIFFLGVESAISYSGAGAELARKYCNIVLKGSQYFPLEKKYGLDIVRRQVRGDPPPKFIKFLVISYIERRKQIEYAIRLANSFEEIFLTVAGSGDARYESELKSMASSKNIEFVGYVGSDQKQKLMSEHDFLLFPTQKDSWGFVVNEGLYCGLPVLGSSNAMAVRDLVRDGINGFVFGSYKELEIVFVERIAPMMRGQNICDYNDMSGAAIESMLRYNKQILANFYELLK